MNLLQIYILIGTVEVSSEARDVFKFDFKTLNSHEGKAE